MEQDFQQDILVRCKVQKALVCRNPSPNSVISFYGLKLEPKGPFHHKTNSQRNHQETNCWFYTYKLVKKTNIRIKLTHFLQEILRKKKNIQYLKVVFFRPPNNIKGRNLRGKVRRSS
jgi:hypothetical protein